MKNVFKVLLGVIIGMVLMFVAIKIIVPFDYDYNKQEGTITFNVNEYIVSDYETIERRFDDNTGTTFKVYFEQ